MQKIDDIPRHQEAAGRGDPLRARHRERSAAIHLRPRSESSKPLQKQWLLTLAAHGLEPLSMPKHMDCRATLAMTRGGNRHLHHFDSTKPARMPANTRLPSGVG